MTKRLDDATEGLRDRPVVVTDEMIDAAADAVQSFQFDMSAQEARGIARAALAAAIVLIPRMHSSPRREQE